MKLSAYIITVDSGFAPNPFGRFCTLACCKPTIRRMAEKDDTVIACASSSAARSGKWGGLWDRILRHLQARKMHSGEIDWQLFAIDGTVIRAHQSAAGAAEKKSAGGRTG